MDLISSPAAVPDLYFETAGIKPAVVSFRAFSTMPVLRKRRPHGRGLRSTWLCRLLLVGSATTGALVIAAAPAHAQVQVDDPWSSQERFITYDQALLNVADGIAQLQQLQGQLSAARSLLQGIDPETAPNGVAAVTAQAKQILQSASAIGFNSANAGAAFARQYPTTFTVAGFNNTQLASALSAWQSNNSNALQMAGQATTSGSAQPTTVQAAARLLATVGVQLTQLRAILLTQTQAEAGLSGDPQQAEDAAKVVLAAAKSEIPTSIVTPLVVPRPHLPVEPAVAKTPAPAAPSSARSAEVAVPAVRSAVSVPPVAVPAPALVVKPPAPQATVALQTAGAVTLDQVATILAPVSKRSVTFNLSSADEYKKSDLTHRVRLTWSGPLQALVDQLGQIYGLDVAMDETSIRFSSSQRAAAGDAPTTRTP